MISLNVNGKAETLDVADDMPLLYALRDGLHLTGTKIGCGKGACGACTVLWNGVAVRACKVPVKSVAGSSILTIEGLSPEGNHPLQRAWVQHQVGGCGYCHGGQIMQAAALLARGPAPSEAEIMAAMSDNRCRCMAYPRIRAAIQTASAMMKDWHGRP